MADNDLKPSFPLYDPETHFQGAQVVNGEVVLRGSMKLPDGSRVPLFLPIGLAHTMGCMLIEMAQLGRERESELRKTDHVLDVNDVPDFGTRVEKRMRLNGSTATVTRTPK